MYKYQCIVQKQNSATHNVCWKQRFLAELSKAGYHSDSFEYTHPEAGSLRLYDLPTCYRVLSETIPSSKIVKVIDSMYDYESSGVTIDKSQMLKEVGIVTLIAAGFVAAIHVSAHQASKQATKASERAADTFQKMEDAMPRGEIGELQSLWHDADEMADKLIPRGQSRLFDNLGTKMNEAIASGKEPTSETITKVLQDFITSHKGQIEGPIRTELVSKINPEDVLKECRGVFTPQSMEKALTMTAYQDFSYAHSMLEDTMQGLQEQIEGLRSASLFGNAEVSEAIWQQQSELAESARQTAHNFKSNANNATRSAASIVATSAIVSLMSNFKHKRPLIDTEHGVRVCLVIPTEKTEAEINEILATISKDTVKGTVTPVEGMANTYKVVAPANKLRVYMFTAIKDHDNVLIQAWSHSGNGDNRKEKDFPPDINGSKIIGTSIMKTLRNLLGKKTVFENNPDVDVSTDIDTAEKILEIAAEVS